MSRVVLWWLGVAASAVMVIAALGTGSGTCADSVAPGASSCSRGGSGGLLLVGLAVATLSVVMLRRAYRAQRPGPPR